ncbi:protein-tyrosine phosphatase [Weissella uvarum]|nr:tyrosine-protein phosphatase [Weissella uvarum]MBM7617185.1 protein-tyrosine phosphatase [Weissella uvarum]
MTQDDIDYLVKDKNLKKIFDFRSQNEVQSAPDTDMDGVDYENIDMLASATSNSASIEDMLAHADNINKSMLQTYEQLVLSKSAQEGYHKFLTEMLENPQPSIFHCFAGKDRTGFGAALILKILGASDEQIMEDYLETNQMRKKANDQIIEHLKGDVSEQQLNALKVALNVDKSYLEHANDVINEHYGNFDNYLKEGLGLDDKFVEDFRKEFLE